MRHVRLLTLAAVLAFVALPARALAAPPIRHVFVIVLENEDYGGTFGSPAADPYLARTLPSEGALLANYYGIGHESNPNYLALVSGQPPNPATQSDCQSFTDFAGSPLAANAGPEPAGVAAGAGCVYPTSVPTIGNQLSSRGLSWKGYMQDMGNDPNREAGVCGHPAIDTQDHTQSAEQGDGYATRHDPFVYFHSVIDDAGFCDAHVVPLGGPDGAMPASAPSSTTGLATDLSSAATTPAFSFITPNLCADGHDYPCTNESNGPSALADIDSFLQTWVPRITGSPAFRQGGLLEITFDESSGPSSDASACCGEQPGPSSPSPGISGPGGGRVGAVLLSPYIRPGTVTTTPYNHYASLASWEQIFGLAPLADAQTVTSTFGADVFTDPSGASAPGTGSGAPSGAPSPGTRPGGARTPPVASCPPATGRLTATGIGPFRLGRVRAAERRIDPNFRTHRRRNVDVFCLRPHGVRVNYGSSAVLSHVPGGGSRRLVGRAVLLLTTGARYRVAGVRAGTRLAAARRRFRLGRPIVVGRARWYVVRLGAGRAVLKVTDGVVAEVGVIDPRLVRTRAEAARYLGAVGA